jgi:GxxExxY protein
MGDGHLPLSPEEERIAAIIVDSAFTVHKALGPGLLESVYEACFCHELTKRKVPYKRQVYLPIVYDGDTIEEAFRIDVFVDDRVICEIKAADEPNPVWVAQTLSYLKFTHKRLGFLINFNVPLIKDGIRRLIL